MLDFNARNKEQAYLDTVPPKVKEAIQAHHVLVGMNQEMVLHAKGKPPKKVRERDGDTEYEEWIYGEPPADVDFVRFVGDEVVRVETMKVGGEKIVRTRKGSDAGATGATRQRREQEPAGASGECPELAASWRGFGGCAETRKWGNARCRLRHHRICPGRRRGRVFSLRFDVLSLLKMAGRV